MENLNNSSKVTYVNKCLLCKKTLKPIGCNRKNNTNCHNDWSTRRYHKKCYKILWKT